MSARFFVDTPLKVGDDINLPPATVRHIQVLRLKPKEKVFFFNGDGHDYASELDFASKNKITARVTEAVTKTNESPLRLYLLFSLISSQKTDWLLQKAVELGVTGIRPVFSARTQGKMKESQVRSRLKRWREIIIAAAEQSGRATLPDITPPAEFSTLVQDLSSRANRYIFHPTHEALSLKAAKADAKLPFYLAFGPEGGWTTEEINAARELGWQTITLGPRILRAETAPLAALANLQSLYGDF